MRSFSRKPLEEIFHCWEMVAIQSGSIFMRNIFFAYFFPYLFDVTLLFDVTFLFDVTTHTSTSTHLSFAINTRYLPHSDQTGGGRVGWGAHPLPSPLPPPMEGAARRGGSRPPEGAPPRRVARPPRRGRGRRGEPHAFFSWKRKVYRDCGSTFYYYYYLLLLFIVKNKIKIHIFGRFFNL